MDIFVSNIYFIGKRASESYRATKKSVLNIEEAWNEKWAKILIYPDEWNAFLVCDTGQF